ncbi:hypothetical protein [Streptomyces sp. KHY 26]|uniref:hypothetical protein n=1 Tax=Streptomyces sp. KHY 26 TaxID=3097359 RepID=UPI00376EDA64
MTTRVTPVVHDRLRELAERRGTSLAATAADLLSTAVTETDGAPPPDGSLVGSVLELLGGMTAPGAVVLGEVALRMARIIERGERGSVAAAERLMDAMEKAQRAQHEADNPGADTLDLFLGGLGRLGL